MAVVSKGFEEIAVAQTRIVGWIAHVLKQLADDGLIRPLSEHTGPKGLKVVPIDRR